MHALDFFKLLVLKGHWLERSVCDLVFEACIRRDLFVEHEVLVFNLGSNDLARRDQLLLIEGI